MRVVLLLESIFSALLSEQKIYTKEDVVKLYYKKIESSYIDYPYTMSQLDFTCDPKRAIYSTIVKPIHIGRRH
jgi:hypothetical protein